MADGQDGIGYGNTDIDARRVLETIADDVRIMAAKTPPPPCTTTSSRIVAETVCYALFKALYGARPDDLPYPPAPLHSKVDTKG